MNSKEYAQLLYDVLKDKPANLQSKIIANFKNALLKNKEAYLSHSILKEFKYIVEQHETDNFTYISSASELSSSQKKDLMGIFGNTMEFTVNKELLGGIAVRQKDILHNNTLKKQLEILRNTL